MPLDVLNEIEQARQNIDPNNEELAKGLDNLIEKAKQSSENMNALRGIVQGLTSDGGNLANSLDKVISYFNRFEEKNISIKNTVFGISSAYSDLGNVAPSSLLKIEKELQQISVMQEQLGRGVHFTAIDNVQILTRQVQKLRDVLKNMPKISNKAFSHVGKYALGGRVPGHSTTGDKVPILVNSGEYILNQSQMKRIGRAMGGKSPSQVFQYASGRNNTRGSIKNGYQAFAKGGYVGPMGGARESLQKELIKLREQAKKLTGQAKKQNTEQIDVTRTLLDYVKKLNKTNSKDAKLMASKVGADFNINFKDSKSMEDFISKASLDKLKEFNLRLRECVDEIGNIEKEVKGLHGVQETLDDQADEMIKKYSSWLKGSPVGLAAMATGVAMVGNAIVKASDKLRDFVKEASHLSRDMSVFQSSLDILREGISLNKLRGELDLTREQALQLKSSFMEVGIAGQHDMSVVSEIAANLRNTLGEVDVAKLQEAVNLIQSLPKQQVDVLLHGTGTFDDKANLMANLIESGNLDKGIDLMMHGAFGQMQGTVNVPEKDKAIIKTLNKTNKLVDDLKMGLLYDYLPQWAAEFGTWTSMATKIVGAITSIAGPLLIGGRALWKLNTVVFPSMGVKTISNNTEGGNVKSEKGGGIAKSAIYGAVGIAMAALGTYLVNKSVESQKQRADQYKRNAVTLQRQNLSRYGINHDFTGQQTGELVKQNAAKLGAEWKDTGNKIAIAIDAIAVGLAGVTSGLSLIAIPLAHLGAYIVGEIKQAYESDKHKEMRVKTGTAFNKNGEFDEQFNAKIDEYLKPFIDALSDANNPIFQWSEKERKSLLRSALQAKKALFSVDYIVKGKLTQFAQLQTKAALSNLKQIQMMGGDNKSVASNISILARESTKAFTTQMRLLNQQKTDIFNNNQMDSATKAVVLDEVKKQEIEIYQRFNESLQAIVNNMMELPSIMINDAKLAMRQNMGNFFNKNFGLGGTSFTESREVGDMVVSNMAQAIKANSHAVEELTEAHRQAQQAVKNNTQALEKVKKQTGMNESQADAILKERDRRNEQAFKDDKEAMAVLQQAKEIHESIHKVIEKGDEASAKDKGAAKQSQEQLIGLYEGLKKNPELMERMGLDEDQIDEILKYIKSVDVSNAKNRKKILQDAANGKRSAAVLVGVLQALLRASEKNRFTNDQKKQHQSAEKVKTAQMMANSARGSEVSAAKKLEEANKKFIAKIEQEQNYFINSLKQSFNDGAKRFQQALANYYDRSWEFNQYGSGNANLENMLYANSDLLKTMQDNYAKNKTTAQDTLTKAFATVNTLMSQPQQDPEVIEYLAKYKKMLEYQAKALANPQDAASVALAKNAAEQLKLMEETNRNVADFKKQNQDKLVSATAIAGSYAELLEERIAIEQQQMKLINKIGNAIELRLSAIQNKIPRQTAELYASYAQYGELTGDYKGAALYGRAAIDTTAFSVAKDNADAQANREKALDDARRHYQQNIDSGMDKEKALNILRDETLKIEKQFIDTRKNGIIRITKQIQQAFKIQQDHIKRIEQGIDIQRDVANTIGAPFETILELEQRRVDLAREQLESAEEELKTMEEKGITGKALEEQKLKVSQAQAEVIKRAWGAQRDALDKMLGKVMGTFQQIGGIFGPNGARMQARKYGQGYGVTPSGQIERAMQGYGGRQNVMHGRMRGQGLFASGGEIPGHSTSGDKVMAFVNSGEWILNPRQMNKLADTLGLEDAEDVFDISNGKKFAKGGKIGKFKKYSMSIEEAKAGRFSRAEDYMTDEEQAENEKAKNKLKGVEMQGSEAGNEGVQNDKGVSVDKNTGMAKVENTNADDSGDYIKKIYKNTSEMLKLAKGQATSEDTGREALYVKEMTQRLNELRENGASGEELGAAENDLADAKFRLLEKQEKIKPRWGEVIYYEQEILKVLKGNYVGRNVKRDTTSKSSEKPKSTTQAPKTYPNFSFSIPQSYGNTSSKSVKFPSLIPNQVGAMLSQGRRLPSLAQIKSWYRRNITGRLSNDELSYQQWLANNRTTGKNKNISVKALYKYFQRYSPLGRTKAFGRRVVGGAKALGEKFISGKVGEVINNINTLKEKFASSRFGKFEKDIFDRVSGFGKTKFDNIGKWGKNVYSKMLSSDTAKGIFNKIGDWKNNITDRMGTWKNKIGDWKQGITDRVGSWKQGVTDRVGLFGEKITSSKLARNITGRLSGEELEYQRWLADNRTTGRNKNISTKALDRYSQRYSALGKAKALGRRVMDNPLTRGVKNLSPQKTLGAGLMLQGGVGLYNAYNAYKNAGNVSDNPYIGKLQKMLYEAQDAGDFKRVSIIQKELDKTKRAEQNRISSQKRQAFISGGQSIGSLVMGLGNITSRNSGINKMGMAGLTISALSSLPGLFATKQGKNGREWDGYTASQHAQNLANIALMSPTLAGFGKQINPKVFGWGMALQGLGMGANLLAENMQPGSARNRVSASGDFASNAGSLVSDIGLTMSTGGLNKVVQGVFDVGRKTFTKQGRRRAENVGTGTQIYDTITKLAATQTIFKGLGSAYDAAFGTTSGRKNMDIEGMIKDIDSSLEYSKSVDVHLGQGLTGKRKKRYEELVARKNQLNKEQTSFGNNFLETIGIDSGYSDRLKELNKIEQEIARLRNQQQAERKEKFYGERRNNAGDLAKVADDTLSGMDSLREILSQQLKKSDDIGAKFLGASSEKSAQATAARKATQGEIDALRQQFSRLKPEDVDEKDKINKAIAALEAKLAKQEEQEKVAQEQEQSASLKSELYKQLRNDMLGNLTGQKDNLEKGYADIAKLKKQLEQAQKTHGVDSDVAKNIREQLLQAQKGVHDKSILIGRSVDGIAGLDKAFSQGKIGGKDFIKFAEVKVASLSEQIKKLEDASNALGANDVEKRKKLDERAEQLKKQRERWTLTDEQKKLLEASDTQSGTSAKQSVQLTGKKGHGESESAKSSGYIPPSQDKSAGPKQSTARSVMRRNRGIDFSSPKADASPVAQRGKSGDVKSDVKDAQAQTQVAFGAHVDRFGSAVDRLVAVLPNNGDVKNPPVESNQQVNPNDKASGGNTQNSTTSGGNTSTNGSNGETSQSKPQNNEVSGKLNVTVDVRFNTALFEQTVKRIVLTYASNIVQKGGNQAGGTS